MRNLLPAALIAFLGGCGSPINFVPGGALSGNVTTAPAIWEIGEVEVIQLETRPSNPYSINIWGAGIDANLYVATSPDGTRWTEYLVENPDVRVRIGETNLYELTAVEVTDPDEQALVAQRYVEKYDVDPEENWVATARVIRLDPRER